MVIANATKTIETGLVTAKNWLIPSSGTSTYNLTLPGVNNYNSIDQKFNNGAASIAPVATDPFTRTPNTPTTLPSRGVYEYTGNFNWNESFVGSCGLGGLLIFINGDLTLGSANSVLDFGCPTVVVVSGRILVHGSVNTINAFLISNEEFVSVSGGPTNERLVINGGVISSLSSADSPNFDGRKYTDISENPAVQINFRPEYLWILRDTVGVVTTRYEEVNP